MKEFMVVPKRNTGNHSGMSIHDTEVEAVAEMTRCVKDYGGLWGVYQCIRLLEPATTTITRIAEKLALESERKDDPRRNCC